MSFVDLLANDVWSENDIITKTEAIIRSEFSQMAETILNRKVLGSVIGQYQLSNEEKQELDKYNKICEFAKIEGQKAREDMDLLNRVFPIEKAELRLRLPVVEEVLDDEGNITNQEQIDQDKAERLKAQAIRDAATIDEINLVNLRNPI
jgi:hypothetical protein